MLRRNPIPLALACLALSACLPSTSYVPKPGKVALGVKSGKLTLIKNGEIADRDDMDMLVACDQQATRDARTSSRNFKSSERNTSTAGVFNALTPIFPLAPLIGLPFAIKATRQDQRASAAMVDAINRHNDVPRCISTEGPGSVIGGIR